MATGESKHARKREIRAVMKPRIGSDKSANDTLPQPFTQEAMKSMSQDHQKGLSYRDAGVDIDAGNALVERIKPHAKRTARKESLGAIGGFGALFKIPKGYQSPVLVSGTDGVGTIASTGKSTISTLSMQAATRLAWSFVPP